jgi:hypothetical protein
METRVSALYVYPVKSCAGIAVQSAEVGPLGFTYDRRWMIVDANDEYVTQRKVKSLCRIGTAIDGASLTLTAPEMPTLAIPTVGHANGPERRVRVWDDRGCGNDQGKEAAEWITEFVSRESPGRYRLVFMDHVPWRYARQGHAAISFADGYPFLIISQASLGDLNSRLGEPVPMDRFRPNIVVEGCEPYAEDGWKEILIARTVLQGQAPCARCVIVTVDQTTGENGKEPLKTLTSYRKTPDGKVMFGRNFNHRNYGGRIAVGDRVERIL